MRQFVIILTILGISERLNAQSDSLESQIDSILINVTESIPELIEWTPEIIDPVNPQFPGGLDSLKAFVGRTRNWQVGQKKIVGKVYISFIVDVDGSLTNIEIVKGLHPKCDQEAKRIVKLMPKWNPELHMGKPVRSKMILPISFDGLK